MPLWRYSLLWAVPSMRRWPVSTEPPGPPLPSSCPPSSSPPPRTWQSGKKRLGPLLASWCSSNGACVTWSRRAPASLLTRTRAAVCSGSKHHSWPSKLGAGDVGRWECTCPPSDVAATNSSVASQGGRAGLKESCVCFGQPYATARALGLTRASSNATALRRVDVILTT